LPHQRQAAQREVAGNADSRHRQAIDLGKGAVIHHAAIPLFVDGARLGVAAVMHMQSQRGDDDARQCEQCYQVTHRDFDATRAALTCYPAHANMNAMDELIDQPSSGIRRVAFFGGSFDPPHLGHLAVARAAQTALSLDTVLFAPVGTQPLKPQGATASFEDRLAMTRLAIHSDPGFAVSLADAPKPAGAPNYTLETLLALRAELPAESVLFCLMGADSFALLRSWHRAVEIPFVAPLIVASRPGESLDDLKAALPQGLAVVSQPQPERHVEGIELRRCILRNSSEELAPLYLLPGLEIEISASEIREQVRIREEGSQPSQQRALLPSAVSDYIRAHGLYR